jgi:hypothetical protein
MMPSYPSFLLPDDSVKVRFKEPQVSQALNMKTDGIVPPGIYNGFTPNVGADPNVLLLNTDPYRNDSVAVADVYNLNGAVWTADYNLTIRTTLQVQLDFTGHTVFPCWVVLRPAYSIVAHPFSGLTNAQVVTINDLTVDDTDALALHHGDIKICRVNSTGPVVYNTTIPTNRNDNGGQLVTQTSLAGGISGAFTQTSTIVSTSGQISTASGTFVVVPNTTITLNLTNAQTVVLMASAVSDAAPGFIMRCQIGIRVDGTDYPGDIASLDYVYNMGVHATVPVVLAAGSHTASVVYRAGGASAYLNNSAAFPTRLTILHKG